MNEFIKLKNVSKEYNLGKNILKALDDVNLTMNKGEFVVILGPSGSGKSTLLNLIGGLDNISKGKIIIDNEDISEYNEKELTEYRAKKVGFVFQFYNLIPNLTAIENIELINEITDNKIDGKKLLEKVNLADHTNNFPSELSGGEQQRVSIARAISKQPSILLCDEPTGALDSKSGYNIIKILLELSENDNTTVIVVTHNNEIASLADRIIRIKNGKIEDNQINENITDIDEIDW